jgi:phosphatidylglycerophosphate synthase
MLSKLRPIYEKVTIQFGKISLKLGLSPDFWTIFGLLLSFAGGYLIYQGKFFWGLVLLILMNLADMLDGATARAGDTCNPFGSVFDHVVDRYAEFILIGGFMAGGWISPLVGIFAASGIVMASYVRAKAESIGKLKSCVVGLAGRQEKLFLMMFGLFFFIIGWNNWALACIILIGVISHITAVQRLLYTRSQVFSMKAESPKKKKQGAKLRGIKHSSTNA